MPVPGANVIIDISHYTTITSVPQVASDGIKAVICKATEGATVTDKTYHTNKTLFKNAGFKWGSYHFTSGAPSVDQVANYLHYTKPEPDEFICIDVEPSSSGPNLTLDQLTDMVETIKRELGRYPWIYGGDFLRQLVKSTTTSALSNCPLWFSYYPISGGSPIALPALWKSWTFWQYTNGNVGPAPHSVLGIGHCDRSTFAGSEADLLAQWPFT